MRNVLKYKNKLSLMNFTFIFFNILGNNQKIYFYIDLPLSASPTKLIEHLFGNKIPSGFKQWSLA